MYEDIKFLLRAYLCSEVVAEKRYYLLNKHTYLDERTLEQAIVSSTSQMALKSLS